MPYIQCLGRYRRESYVVLGGKAAGSAVFYMVIHSDERCGMAYFMGFGE